MSDKNSLVPEPGTHRGVRAGLTLMAEAVSLVATAWFVWKFSVSPQLAATTPMQLALKSMGFAVAAWVWSLVIAFLLHVGIRQVDQVDVVGATLRTSAAAVWFAPATILMIHFSPLALPVALVLVINATRLLYSEWRQIHVATERTPILVPQEAWLLGSGELPVDFFPRHFGSALLIAFALQIAGWAELMRRTLTAAALFALGASLLTMFAISAGAWDEAKRPSLPRTIVGLLLTVMLAGSITLVGLAGGGGSAEETGDPLGLVHHGVSPIPPKKPLVQPLDPAKSKADAGFPTPPDKPEDKPDVPVNTGPAADGSYPGVILWPEVKPVTVLIEPMPAIGGKFATASHPLVIPFGGEYWMWRFLLPRPPRNSFFQRGSPAKLSFSTTDHWPLQMEAHQKLPQDIGLSCCARIQLGITNADRYPATVTLELFAGDYSLGKALVVSVPDLSKDPVQPVSETLDYPVPADLVDKTIGSFKVVYQRLRGRTDKSCKIAIERFVLVPRGM